MARVLTHARLADTYSMGAAGRACVKPRNTGALRCRGDPRADSVTTCGRCCMRMLTGHQLHECLA